MKDESQEWEKEFKKLYDIGPTSNIAYSFKSAWEIQQRKIDELNDHIKASEITSDMVISTGKHLINVLNNKLQIAIECLKKYSVKKQHTNVWALEALEKLK